MSSIFMVNLCHHLSPQAVNLSDGYKQQIYVAIVLFVFDRLNSKRELLSTEAKTDKPFDYFDMTQ